MRRGKKDREDEEERRRRRRRRARVGRSIGGTGTAAIIQRVGGKANPLPARNTVPVHARIRG
eukprot:5018900-Pyramimonas_sp.AAC.1